MNHIILLLIIQQTSQETIAAERMAAYRAKKRMTKEGVDELKTKARVYSKNYRMKKNASDARTMNTQRSAAYRARMRSTDQGLKDLRAKSRASSQRHRMKKKMNKNVEKTVPKTGAERQAAYRARKRATLQGTKELREKSRMYNRKCRMNNHMDKKVDTIIESELYRDLQFQQFGDDDVDETNKALMNETLHDFELPDGLGPTECCLEEIFSDFPVTEEFKEYIDSIVG